jgi:hypothetical protein
LIIYNSAIIFASILHYRCAPADENCPGPKTDPRRHGPVVCHQHAPKDCIKVVLSKGDILLLKASKTGKRADFDLALS